MFSQKKIAGFCIFLVSILIINIINDHVTAYLLRHKNITHPTKATIFGMLLTAFVMYPAFKWMSTLIDRLTKNYFKAGKNAAGQRIGLLIAFSVALSVLFAFYLHFWFGMYVWDLL